MAAHVISSASSNEWDLNQWTEIWGKNMCIQGQALNNHGYYWLTNNGWKNVCHRHKGKWKEIVLWSKCKGLNGFSTLLASFCNHSTKNSLKKLVMPLLRVKRFDSVLWLTGEQNTAGGALFVLSAKFVFWQLQDNSLDSSSFTLMLGNTGQ